MAGLLQIYLTNWGGGDKMQKESLHLKHMEIVLYHAILINFHGPVYQKVNLSITNFFSI